jgi:hypothetical protein
MKSPHYLGDFIITRKPVQADQEDGGISLSEWRELIAGDPTLEPVDSILGRNPFTGEGIPIRLQGGVRWTLHPSGTALPFSWDNGRIVCQGFDEITLAKVKELAKRLHAACFEDEA